MKRKHLISQEGTFYKANLHCHTTLSDGAMTPAQIKEMYVRHGYSVVAYTDHNIYKYHEELQDENFIPLAGYEANNDAYRGGNGHIITSHLCAIAIEPKKAKYVPRPATYDLLKINDMIREMVKAGFIVNYNHPSWSCEHTEDYLQLEGITGFEVFNYGCEVEAATGRGYDQYDLWLRNGKKAYAIASDDNHNISVYEGTDEYPANEFDSFGGFNMIKAPDLSYGSIVHSIQQGDMYASSGVLIHSLYVEGDKLCINCDPVYAVMLKGSTALGNPNTALSPVDSLTHVEFDLAPLRKANEKFVRLVLRKRNGLMAWTNAYSLTDI